jgi:hypothetical protein
LEGWYPEVVILPLFRVGSIIAAAWRARVFAREVSKSWRLSGGKSAKKWANQLEEGSWTPDKITDVIRTGKQFPASNRTVTPNRPATRYEKNGEFVVVDDITKEVIQVTRPRPGGFKPN